MSELDRHLKRMTPDNLWPAGHDKGHVIEALAGTLDPGATVLTWASNGQQPMDDMLAAWVVLGLITIQQARATSAVRAAETAKFLAAYRKNPPVIDAEQLHEMRNAFGPGAKVVDVITGRTTQL